MADLLATPEDLATLLRIAVDEAAAMLVLAAATAVVQDAAGNQRLVPVAGDEATILGGTDSWLHLPQRPVITVASVALDGEPLTDWKLIGGRLWRCDGWQRHLYEPSQVQLVYDHGYQPGDHGLQLAHTATLMLARAVYTNPDVVRSKTLGDFSVAYDVAAAQLDAAPNVKAALARKYGIPAGLVRFGGG